MGLLLSSLGISGFKAMEYHRRDPEITIPSSQQVPGASNVRIAPQLKSVVGKGSSCQWGCDEADVSCRADWTSDPDVFGVYHVIDVWSQHWFPHYECRFAWFGSCSSGGDVLCNIIYNYDNTDVSCSYQPRSVDYTTTSSCAVPIGSGGGN